MTSFAAVPDWLSAHPAFKSREPVKAVANVELDAPANVERAKAFLRDRAPAVEGQGGNAYTYATAAALNDLGISEPMALELMQGWDDRCAPPWGEELAVPVANAYRYAQNDPGCYAVAPSQEVFGDAVGRLKLTAPADTPAGYPAPKSAAELAAGTFPRAEYALERFVLREHVNLLYGDGGAGKTLLAEMWAVAIAGGLPWCGLATRQMPALLILAEDDDGETKARLEAICALFECDLSSLPLKAWCLPGLDASIARIQDDGTWQPGPFLAPLRSELAKSPPAFVILDTVSDIAALDETKRPPANTLCKVVLTGLCREFGATILVNAHPSKAAMSDGTGYAGSTGWNNAVRNRLTLERPEPGSPRRVLKVAKSNYGQNEELELFQVGLTFVTVNETAGVDRQVRLRDACVRVAVMAAEDGTPIQKQRRVIGWPMDEIKSNLGYRPSDRDVKEALANALHSGLIRYINGSNLMTAGYYPAELEQAEDLARKARKGAGGVDA